MAAALVKAQERITALEQEVELLKMSSSVPAMIAALQSADPAELKQFLELVQGAAPAPAAKTPKASKPKSEKLTNPEGPSEWNVYKKAVWREMAAGYGVVEEDDEAFKKACVAYKKAHPEALISYQDSMKEAGRRKDALEGRDTAAKEAKKAAAAAAREAKKAGAEAPAVTPKKAAPKKAPGAPKKAAVAAPAAAEPTADEALAEMGMKIKEVDGVKYLISDDGEAFSVTEDGTMGERAGRYDPDSDAVDTTA